MTRLPPTCANCGSSASGEDPRTGKVVCLQCALPNQDQRERVTSEAMAELLRRFEREGADRCLAGNRRGDCPPSKPAEAGTVEGAFEPAGKFHLDCYEELRKSEPEKWPALASPT